MIFPLETAAHGKKTNAKCEIPLISSVQVPVIKQKKSVEHLIILKSLINHFNLLMFTIV